MPETFPAWYEGSAENAVGKSDMAVLAAKPELGLSQCVMIACVLSVSLDRTLEVAYRLKVGSVGQSL